MSKTLVPVPDADKRSGQRRKGGATERAKDNLFYKKVVSIL